MNRRIIIYLAAISIIAGCSKEKAIEPKEIISETEVADASNLTPGFIRIKVNNELGAQLESVTDKSGEVIITKVKSVNDPLEGLNVISMARTFVGPQKFEARKHEMGMDLWYDVIFDKSKSLTKAGEDLQSIEGVTDIEYGYKMKMDSAPFDDPRLAAQWHYFNTGESPWVKEVDINVYPVWAQYTVGNSNIIVAVVDGGIDYSHEDLAANMYINEAEYNGVRGVDDDKNGFVDDIYGYNFVRSTGNITSHRHGTHVAGTISAVNNNGIGVSGIAGGDAAKNIKGVRLLSCQIFDSTLEDDSNGSGAKAIVYSADNGAVICQNSWGYEKLFEAPKSVKNAIDYFVRYAGIDENGQQTGPMAGGLVVFSAGNESSEIYGSPASYEKAMAVAAVGPTGARATYSNYGSWVDISAPGGESGVGMVLSTLPENSYGNMQGTSMACPHVSGVAALIVSYCGGYGFTAQALWGKLIVGVSDVYQYNTAAMRGKLGAGLVNAYNSLAYGSSVPPEKITEFSGDTKSNYAYFNVSIPSDADDNKPYGINIYYSKSPLPDSFDKAILPEDISRMTFNVGEKEAGEILNCTIEGLDFNTEYYCAAEACDYAGNRSEISSMITITTGGNSEPFITPSNISLLLKAHETIVQNFTYGDADGHKVTWSFEAGSDAASIIEQNGKLIVTIIGSKAAAGVYSATITVNDSYSENVAEISYTILENHAPVVIKNIDDMCLGSIGAKVELNLADYFSDEDGESLSYNIVNSGASVVHANPNLGKLYITALAYGMSEITVKGKDIMEKECEQSFKILVRDNSNEIDIYPNPVKDYLYFRTGEQKSSDVAVYNTAGAKVFEENITSSPFSPYKLDMTGLDGGVYTVKVNGTTTKIIKL